MKADILNSFSIEDIQNQFEVFKKAKEFPSAFFSEKANLDFMINSYNKTADPENKIEIDSAIMNQTAGELDKKQREDIICKYKNGIYNDNTKIPTWEEVFEEWSKDLNEVLENCPSPEARMKKLVDYLTENIDIFTEDDWKEDTLRLRILKQFIKYGNGLEYTITTKDENNAAKDETVKIYQGMATIRKYVKSTRKLNSRKLKDLTDEEILAGVDDKIFSVLQDAGKDQKKPGGTYYLLRVANDLASGRFEKNTKQNLYLFAMVFGMSFSISEKGNYDVETGLIDMYYRDEPFRYPGCDEIRDIRYDGRQDNNKYWPPSGQGINPKDFKDVIYLYYLHSSFEKKEDLQARVRDADQMIKRVTENKQVNKTAAENPGTNTYFNSIMSEALKKESKEELEEYIIQNYCVDEAQKQNSAFNEYRKYMFILSELSEFCKKTQCGTIKEKLVEIREALNEHEKNGDLGLWFDETLSKGTEQNDKKQNGKKQNSEKRKDIKDIFLAGLGIKKSDEESDEKSEEDLKKDSIIEKAEKMLGSAIIEKPEDMTRSALIGVYYFCFIKAYEAGLELPNGFHDKLAAFTGPFGESEKNAEVKIFDGIDLVLGEAWYAPMNPNNMFDSLVMLSVASL